MKKETKRGNLLENNGDIVNKRRVAGMTYKEYRNKFPTEEAAIEHFLNIRYNGQLECPHCGSIDYVYRNKGNLKLVQCHTCNNSFSPFRDTIFEKTHTDMRDWFVAIHLFLNSAGGNSACFIQRELEVSYKTAFRMMHKIREAMGNVIMRKAFEGIVEVDEAYIGGKPRKQNALVSDDGTLIPRPYPVKNKRGRGTNKTPVVAVVERKTGRIYFKVALPNEEGKKLTGRQLLAIIEQSCKDGTIVITDDFNAYDILDKDTKYVHLSVNHSKGEYQNYKHKERHTNNVENFWSCFKRGIKGCYIHVSVKYLENYGHEFSFRYRRLGDEGLFDTVLEQSIGA
jgi:transposase-like protein